MENENGEILHCLWCGAEFKRDIRHRQKFCCISCRKQFLKNDEAYQEKARIKRHEVWKYKKKLYCRMCGNVIDRETHDGSSRMHDQCVINDALDTLRNGEVLSKKQISRIFAYGHNITELTEIICKEIEATQKEKNIVTKSDAAKMFNLGMPALNAMIVRDAIRIYNAVDYRKGHTLCKTFVDASELEVYLKKRNVNRRKKYDV